MYVEGVVPDARLLQRVDTPHQLVPTIAKNRPEFMLSEIEKIALILVLLVKFKAFALTVVLM